MSLAAEARAPVRSDVAVMAEKSPAATDEKKRAKDDGEEKANGKGRAAAAAAPAPRADRNTSIPPPLLKDGTKDTTPTPAPLESAAVPVDAEPSSRSMLDQDKTPSLPPLPAGGHWRSYKEVVSGLAQRIVEAQRPIRVLQSLRWDPVTEDAFVKSRYREMPRVTRETYDAIELGFEAKHKEAEFEDIARDVEKDLGTEDAMGKIMLHTALQYRDLSRMLAARGTPMFYAYSRRLYGSPKDKFPDGKYTVRDLGHMLYDVLTKVDDASLGETHPRVITADAAATTLNARFASYFGENAVTVEVDDSILSDAAAGGDRVKVRSRAMFSDRDVDILEVHEGWVHVATSLNGQQQQVARWLAKGPPRTTAVQEGLAALVEIFTFRTYPKRARRLIDRVIAIDKAEDGANFLEVFDWFRTEGYDEEECFNSTRRVFRGGVIEGGAPFTKDACYCKGIVLNYAFIRSAFLHNRADLIPFLFVGKVAHEDVPALARRVADGVVRPPRFLPPMFRDLNGLAIWMAYSSFFSRLSGDAILEHYGKLFASV